MQEESSMSENFDLDGIEFENDIDNEEEDIIITDDDILFDDIVMDDADEIDLSDLEDEANELEESDIVDDIDGIDLSDLGEIGDIEDDSIESEDNTIDDELDASMDIGEIDLNTANTDSTLDFDIEDADTGDIVMDIDDDPKFDDENPEIADIDEQIRMLEAELREGQSSIEDELSDILLEGDSREDSINLADDDGAILDTDVLLGDDEDDFEVASRDADFLSPTGEIVVMDPSDDEDSFKLIYVDIENIAIVKRIRASNNVEDLVKSIKSTGLLKPVDVAPTSADGVYVLLDGYRRILACARAGKRRIPCVVNTRVSVPEIPILEAMYNHSKKYSIKEIIDYIEYLEKQKGIMSASMIEYLLQLNSGEYTKLKDILNDDDEDIVDKLMNGMFTIEQAFKKLEQRRKKESADEKDLKKATRVYEDDPESGAEMIEDSGETADSVELTEEEIQSLAINASDLDDVDDMSLEEMVQEGNEVPGFKPHKQDPKYRERLDPALRKSVLVRDNNTCQICKQISGMEFTEVLDIHHIQEVYLGGSDAIENLITACTVCHKLVHLHGRGQLNMRPIDQMYEVEQARFKRIVTLGNIIRKGMALRGMKLEQLKKLDNADTIGRTKPGSGQEAG